MVKAIRIYFAHPIMGLTGSDEEIEYNIRLAKGYGAFMRAYLGPGYDIYVPAEHDEMPQIAYYSGTFRLKDILSADLVVVDRCQILVAGRWAPSKGVCGEVDHAREVRGLYTYDFWDLEGLICVCDSIGGIEWPGSCV